MAPPKVYLLSFISIYSDATHSLSTNFPSIATYVCVVYIPVNVHIV
jgi:hypothetical protein